jgi:hypothetical protein
MPALVIEPQKQQAVASSSLTFTGTKSGFLDVQQASHIECVHLESACSSGVMALPFDWVSGYSFLNTRSIVALTLNKEPFYIRSLLKSHDTVA